MEQTIKQPNTITLPGRLFRSMIEAHQKWEQFSDEFEGFMLIRDKEFVGKMRNARQEHIQGKTKDLADFKQEL